MNATNDYFGGMSMADINFTLWGYLVEDAFYEAVRNRTPLTVIGFIDGELHVPSYGMIL